MEKYKKDSWVMIKLSTPDQHFRFAHIENVFIDNIDGIDVVIYEVLVPKITNHGDWIQFISENEIIMGVA